MIDNPTRSALLSRLTSDNPETIDAAAKSTWDLEALGEAWHHWKRQADHANKICGAISYRMNQIRGS